ncbi:hypothetical protein MGYG_00893 [Nannizzia gypsea CBS 118893]|uniref:Uncharacterized protein n=1 Tax=Arthroderma gypseum (strain ATCC MYA-4604 / CBS 118893) TaxID=535722 RepID=E5R2H8_ARTGP|nr:hypothetical protein MGYG_00893 [Nannizzia gypsea CBS 118893]EFQ97854.1 hypothetical protein MGYG_00893 [Nannizzia gypsea CBS 118893]
MELKKATRGEGWGKDTAASLAEERTSAHRLRNLWDQLHTSTEKRQIVSVPHRLNPSGGKDVVSSKAGASRGIQGYFASQYQTPWKAGFVGSAIKSHKMSVNWFIKVKERKVRYSDIGKIRLRTRTCGDSSPARNSINNVGSLSR